MLIQFQDYLTIENIYLWTSIGVLPFWFMLIIIPKSTVTQILVNSIILPLIFSILIVYLIYQAIQLDEPVLDIFKLFFSIDNLYTFFSSEHFLLIFWIHFLAINLFLGSWAARDSSKYNMSRKLAFIPLVLIYFTGPLGLVLYWFFRIFYAKKLGFHD